MVSMAQIVLGVFFLSVASFLVTSASTAPDDSPPPVEALDGVIVVDPLPEVPPPEIGDPPNAAELQDLQHIATQRGITLEEAIEKYAWRDNLALAVAQIRELAPEGF